jgi:hypothetical protein
MDSSIACNPVSHFSSESSSTSDKNTGSHVVPKLNLSDSVSHSFKRQNIHSKYVTPQQVANLIVLQPPIQDNVLPLLLIDLRSYEEYCTSHIECSISMQIPEKLLTMSEEELIQLSQNNEISGNSSPYSSPRRVYLGNLTSPRQSQHNHASPTGTKHARTHSGSIPSSDINTQDNNISSNTTVSPSFSPTCSPRTLISQSLDPAAESILKLLETTCFQEKIFASKFYWRHLSHAILFIDCDKSKSSAEEVKKKKKVCRWIYRLLKREHRIKALSILKASFQEFQRAIPFLITNKRHKEFDYPTIVNSFIYLGSHRLLMQPGGLDIVMKKKLGVQYVLNCAQECHCVIPEHYLEENQFTYMKVDLESDVKVPLSHVLSFDNVCGIINFIELARKHNQSLQTANKEREPSPITEFPLSFQSIEQDLISKSGKRAPKESAKLFIHCHEGRCRAIAICSLYFMVRLSWDLETSLQFFKVHRPLVNITEPYMSYLQRFCFMLNSIERRQELQLSALFSEMKKRWNTMMLTE